MIEIECVQYTAEFWEAHRGLPGASDADSVATPAKGDYPASADILINKLIADQYDPFYGLHDENATAAMQNGIRSEPKARSWLEYELDTEIEEVGICISDCGRYCNSPDGMPAKREFGVEMKVPNIKTHVKYMRAKGLPNIYRPQVHWSLIVTGLSYWYWCSWNPFLPAVIVKVEPNEFTEKLRANMERFHGEYMKALDVVKAQIPLPEKPPTVIHDFGRLGTLETQPGEVVSHF